MDLNKSKIKAAILFMLWLLFMPNAPYMITDLIHLRLRQFVPLWFDMLLICSFAWLGLLLALLSVMNMHRKLQARLSPLVLRAGLFVIFFSAGYGIYAGRFLRWNSWDVFWRPFQLIGYTAMCVIHPFHHPCAAGVTVIVGMILSCSYSVIYLLTEN